MTTTLNDQARESVRWFAEECLGWDYIADDANGNPWWREGEYRFSRWADDDLTGWPGFGRVVEYVRATTEGRWAMSLTMSSLSREFLADLRFGHGVQTACHHDPAIAAMLALRQAVGDA